MAEKKAKFKRVLKYPKPLLNLNQSIAQKVVKLNLTEGGIMNSHKSHKNLTEILNLPELKVISYQQYQGIGILLKTALPHLRCKIHLKKS